VISGVKTEWVRGGFLKENFSYYVENGFGGFARWKNNSLGFRNDEEFTITKPKDTFRILSIGDSFTAGYRVDQNQTFSFLVEKALNEQNENINVEVMISMIKDPYTGLEWLKKYGTDYDPDLIIVGVTLGNDISQVLAKSMGDELSKININERLPEDCLIDRSENAVSYPKWSDDPNFKRRSWIYKFQTISLLMSFIAKHNSDVAQTVASDSREYIKPKVFESHGLAYFLVSPNDYVIRAYDALKKVLLDYKTFSLENNIELLLVIFPQRFQVQPPDWGKTVEIYGLRSSCFDLAIPNQLIIEECNRLDLKCLDPAKDMNEAYVNSNKSLYLPNHDMHWGENGHMVLSQILYKYLNQNVEIPKR